MRIPDRPMTARTRQMARGTAMKHLRDWSPFYPELSRLRAARAAGVDNRGLRRRSEVLSADYADFADSDRAGNKRWNHRSRWPWFRYVRAIGGCCFHLRNLRNLRIVMSEVRRLRVDKFVVWACGGRISNFIVSSVYIESCSDFYDAFGGGFRAPGARPGRVAPIDR